MEDDAYLAPLELDLGEMPLAIKADDRPGHPSVFTCPECHGTLWEVDEGGVLRFRVGRDAVCQSRNRRQSARIASGPIGLLRPAADVLPS
jgi:hypothetical protein